MFDGDKMGRLAGGVLICVVLLAGTISAKDNPGFGILETLKSINWKKHLPWATEEHDFKGNIQLTLVKKDWKPILTKMPDDEQVLPTYPGSIEDVHVAFYDQKNKFNGTQKPLDEAVELLSGDYGYDPKLESIFFIQNRNDNLAKKAIIGMGMRNMLKMYNLFVFDVRLTGERMFVTGIKEIVGMQTMFPDVAKAVVEFFDSAINQNLIKPNQIHVTGFCWAALASGFVAKYIKERHNKKIKSVLACDPHSLGVSSITNEVLLADDAEAVHVFHTNSLMLGTFRRRATADIVFNNGLLQPGCEKLEVMCNHARSVVLFWYSIIYPDLFVARKCSSWFDFNFCHCNEEMTIQITYPPDPKVTGEFYLNTIGIKPYALGNEGAICVDEDVEDIEIMEEIM